MRNSTIILFHTVVVIIVSSCEGVVSHSVFIARAMKVFQQKLYSIDWESSKF